jgi:dimethylamine monooxygenase subunit C
MQPPAIKSQPVYPPLEWDRAGTQHILFIASADDDGTRGLLTELPAGSITLIHLPGSPDPAFSVWLEATHQPMSRHEAIDLDHALLQLDHALSAAHMGARLYLIGPEDAIWRASKVAATHGMSRDEMRLRQSGTLARPVYCVHCRHVTRGVRTSIAACGGCARSLFVRDHFSRHLGAYMGFQIDAEAPGQVPDAVMLYP